MEEHSVPLQPGCPKAISAQLPELPWALSALHTPVRSSRELSWDSAHLTGTCFFLSLL